MNNPIEPLTESKPFEFTHDGQKYNAIVRYYSDNSRDIELDSDNTEAHDKAWKVAEELGLIKPYTQVIDCKSFIDNVINYGWLPPRLD